MRDFKVGDTVCLNANPKCRFDVIAVEEGITDCVGFDGKKAYIMKLPYEVLSSCARPLQDEQTVIILPAKDIHQD